MSDNVTSLINIFMLLLTISNLLLIVWLIDRLGKMEELADRLGKIFPKTHKTSTAIEKRQEQAATRAYLAQQNPIAAVAYNLMPKWAKDVATLNPESTMNIANSLTEGILAKFLPKKEVVATQDQILTGVLNQLSDIDQNSLKKKIEEGLPLEDALKALGLEFKKT